ncbi:MAG: homocysteine S-methyltransferase [Limosilactobacillus sp.]|uniref:homocysteine S-methyltransferase n=1 Tax=Limosilactobacillus sp. TaxID=2773925 RepID=UPI00270651E7|nr:homocysteine S-methyltransferase [Limosilactobacillus sp.]
MQLLEKLTQGPLLLDGSMSTPLEQAGADTNSDLWTAKALIDSPQLVYQVHMDYFKSGADLSITDTYQTNVPAFVRHGLSENDAKELIKKAVRLATQARDDYEKESGKHNFVAGGIGPYGAYLADGSEYRGDYDLSDEELKAFHRPRLEAIVEEGVDCLAVETQPQLKEVLAFLDLLKEVAPEVPAFISFSLKDKDHISDGTPLKDAVATVKDNPQVFSVGVNCMQPELTVPAVEAIKDVTDKAIIVYPNSGATYDPSIKQWTFKEGQPHIEDRVQSWIDAGATIVGGCCTIVPSDIKKMAEVLK